MQIEIIEKNKAIAPAGRLNNRPGTLQMRYKSITIFLKNRFMSQCNVSFHRSGSGKRQVSQALSKL